MQALTFQGKCDVRAARVADARIEARTDAVVRVALTAICGSDLHVYHEREQGLDHGTVMGHEFVGEIAEVGGDVQGLSVGDRVLSPFTTSCGDCFYCRLGLSARCARGQLFGWVREGVGLEGTQAEAVRVPLAASTLVRVPEEVSNEIGLLMGDVMATGYYCAKRAGIRPEGVYAVLGCGPVGLMAIIGALELGARTLFAVDSIAERLSHAAKLGARPIDLGSGDPVAALREATDGRGADAVLEVVGSAAANRLAVDLVRPGGVISAVGVHTEASFSFSPTEAYDKNLTYRIGRCPVRSLLEELTPLARADRHDMASILSHRMPLAEGRRGYEIFDGKQDGCTKVVLTP